MPVKGYLARFDHLSLLITAQNIQCGHLWCTMCILPYLNSVTFLLFIFDIKGTVHIFCIFVKSEKNYKRLPLDFVMNEIHCIPRYYRYMIKID